MTGLRNSPGETPHGTPSRYNNDGCRCDDCRAAASAARLEWVQSLRDRPSADIPHGSTTGYRNWGCRCEPCRRAGAASRKGKGSSVPPEPGRPRARPRPKPGDLPFAEIPHGTTDGWKLHRCLCDSCAKRRADDRNARRRAAYWRARGLPEPAPEPEEDDIPEDPDEEFTYVPRPVWHKPAPGRRASDGTD
jgi:hypothetical protein